MQAAGKVWVVTGGGDGMGRQIVFELLRHGARVAAVDVRPEALEATLALTASPARLSTHVVDITDRGACEALVGAVTDAHGTVDGLINNAGIIQPFIPVSEMDYPTIERVLNVNFMGTLYMTKAFLPTLLERPEAHLANVSSMGGFFPFPGQTIYGASKAAVILLTEGLYAELLDTNVHVSVVIPGATNTGISEHSGVHTPVSAESSPIPMTSPEKAARIIVGGLAKNRLRILVGPDTRFMDVAIKIAPKQATKLVQRRMKGLLE